MATGEDVEVKFHASIDRVIRGNKLSAHRNCRPGRDLFLRSRPFQNGRYASLRRLRIDGYRHRGPCGHFEMPITAASRSTPCRYPGRRTGNR
jgi:hypothetical protein